MVVVIDVSELVTEEVTASPSAIDLQVEKSKLVHTALHPEGDSMGPDVLNLQPTARSDRVRDEPGELSNPCARVDARPWRRTIKHAHAGGCSTRRERAPCISEFLSRSTAAKPHCKG